MHYFDYGKIAAEAQIPARKLARLRSMIRREFPRDEMIFELHMLRTCMAIRDGHVTIEQALAEDSEAAA